MACLSLFHLSGKVNFLLRFCDKATPDDKTEEAVINTRAHIAADVITIPRFLFNYRDGTFKFKRGISTFERQGPKLSDLPVFHYHNQNKPACLLPVSQLSSGEMRISGSRSLKVPNVLKSL